MVFSVSKKKKKRERHVAFEVIKYRFQLQLHHYMDFDYSDCPK